MTDADCVRLLQWALPRLGLEFAGYRKVRRQVCRRIQRRAAELGLGGVEAYRAYLERHEEEWEVLDGFCHVTISRFFRDRGVFAFLADEVLPALARSALARGEHELRVWSAGCASGEEPYSIALAGEFSLAPGFPGLRLHILATDVDEAMLERARAACYEASSLKELPPGWRERAFLERCGEWCLREELRRKVTVARHDVRRQAPDGPFDLVLCRNLAFTYFDLALQRLVAAKLAAALRPGGALVLGSHERLPDGLGAFEPWAETLRVYRRLHVRRLADA